MTALIPLDPDGEDLLGLPVCKKCDEVHERNGKPTCLAHSARTGKRCRSLPVPGGSVCTIHGGVMQAQGRQLTELRRQQEMEYATSMLGLVNYDMTPEEALLQTVREAAANVHFLRARVQEIVGSADLDDPEHPLVWGTTNIVSTGASATPGDDETQAAGANIWYEMYVRERELLLKASTAAVRAGIAERRVRLAEMGAEVIVGRIRQILNALNLTPEQIQESDRVVPLQIAMLAQDLEAQQV